MLKIPFGSYHMENVGDFMLCVHSILPKTQVIRFERKKDESGTLGEIDWEKPIFTREDPPEDMLSAYTGPCKGDSGAPSWFCVKNINNEARFVVAAVHTTGAGRIYDDNKKEFLGENVLCGHNIFIYPHFRKYYSTEKEFVRYLGISQSITHPKIFDWLKAKMLL